MKGIAKEALHREREDQLLKLQVRFPGTVQVIPAAGIGVYNNRFNDDVLAACLQQSFEKNQARFSGSYQVVPAPENVGENTYTRRLQNLRDEVEAACLQQSIERNVNLEEEKNSWRKLREMLNAEFEGLKAEVEAVRTAMEIFNAEAEQSKQVLTTYKVAFEQKLQNLMQKVEEQIEDRQGDQNEMVRTVAEEQKIIRFTLTSEATMQVITLANLVHLVKLEELCGKTIQKLMRVRDPGRR